MIELNIQWGENMDQENKHPEEKKINRIKLERHKWPDEIEAEKKATRKKILVVLLCIACFAGGFVVSTGIGTNSQTHTTTNSNSSKFNKIYNIMKNDWYYSSKQKNISNYLTNKAINGMVNSTVDKHTEYFSKSEAKSLTATLSGSFDGVGIELYKLNGDFIIDRVFAESPAEKIGLKEGDIILKVDGVSTSNMTSKKLVNKIRGKKGTKVTLTIKRDNTTKDYDVTRDNVAVSTYGYVDSNNTAVIEISTIATTTNDEVKAYLKEFKKKGVNDLVIDLRNNGGGYVNTAVAIASNFMPDGTKVLYEKDANGSITSTETDNNGDYYKFNKLVVLVDGDTASAAEILTASLKHDAGAVVVGTKTYGKGTVQTTTEFNDGSMLKYTVGEWLTPEQKSINNKGIKPDYEVKLDEALTHVDSKEKDKSYSLDSVGDRVADVQIYLKFIGYAIDRTDGYFSAATDAAVRQFQSENGITIDGKITKSLLKKIELKAALKWHQNRDSLDTQLIKAKEIASGK